MSRRENGLYKALEGIGEIREKFWKEVRVPGSSSTCNPTLEQASRVADFLDFAELMVSDALQRRESCGSHFREESQTEEGEPKRDDAGFNYVAAWEFKGPGRKPELHREELVFETQQPSVRSYR
jgi:succinate dehydrogenase / fumarate reductase flavoprotein subunit